MKLLLVLFGTFFSLIATAFLGDLSKAPIDPDKCQLEDLFENLLEEKRKWRDMMEGDNFLKKIFSRFRKEPSFENLKKSIANLVKENDLIKKSNQLIEESDRQPLKIKSDSLKTLIYYSRERVLTVKERRFIIDEIAPLVITQEVLSNSPINIDTIYAIFEDDFHADGDAYYFINTCFYRYNLSGIEHIIKQLFLKDTGLPYYLRQLFTGEIPRDQIKKINLQKILTPPDTLMSSVQKQVRDKMLVYMLCLKSVRKKNNLKFPYPRPILLNYIVYPVVEALIPEPYKKHASYRKKEMDRIIGTINCIQEHYNITTEAKKYLNKLYDDKKILKKEFFCTMNQLILKNNTSLRQALRVIKDVSDKKILEYYDVKFLNWDGDLEGLKLVFNQDFIEGYINPARNNKAHYAQKLLEINDAIVYQQKVINQLTRMPLQNNLCEKITELTQKIFFFTNPEFKEWVDNTMNLSRFIFNGMIEDKK